MLTYGQLKLSHIFYRICFKFCLLPLKLDHLTFSATNGPRYYVWKLQYLISAGHGIFMGIRLLQLLLLDSEDINLIYFSIHAVMAMAGILVCMYYKILITQKENNLLLCNELWLQVKGAADEKYGLYRLGKDLLRLWKFSVPEVLLILLPIVMFGFVTVFTPIIYILQHDSPQFLYSLCPQEFRSIQSVILFAAIELWLFCHWSSTGFHFGFITAVHLQRSIDICKDETARLSRGAAVAPTKVIRRYREFLLKTQVYNLLFSGVVYVTKLLFLAMAILGFFIVIRFGSKLHPLNTGINLAMGVLGAFLYSFLYDAAVWMPSKFHDLKRCVYSFLTKEVAQDRAHIRRELLSLPAVELKVGSFDCFRQTTIPEFIDFAVQQICSLVLTF